MICFSRLLAFAIPQLIDYVRCERDRKSSKANSEDKSERGEREKKNKEKNLVVLSYIALGPFFFLYTIIMAIQNTCMIKIFLACL